MTLVKITLEMGAGAERERQGHGAGNPTGGDEEVPTLQVHSLGLSESSSSVLSSLPVHLGPRKL